MTSAESREPRAEPVATEEFATYVVTLRPHEQIEAWWAFAAGYSQEEIEAYVASYRRTMKWATAELDVALKAFGQELRKGLPRFVRRWFS